MRKGTLMNSSKWKMWKAILDLRTCLICRKNHGKIYEINEFVYNLRSKINYQEATDEDIINFYEALAKILK